VDLVPIKNMDAVALSTVKKLMSHCTTTKNIEVDVQRLSFSTIVHCTTHNQLDTCRRIYTNDKFRCQQFFAFSRPEKS